MLIGHIFILLTTLLGCAKEPGAEMARVSPDELNLQWIIKNSDSLDITVRPIDTIKKHALGIDELAACAGGGNNPQDIEFQNIKFAHTLVSGEETALPAIGNPNRYGFTVLEEPKEGKVQCCKKSSDPNIECAIPSSGSQASNCTVYRDDEIAIYCGTIRDNAYTDPGTKLRIRPEDVAFSFVFYRAGAVAMSQADVNPLDVWDSACNLPGARIFNWATISEIATAQTLNQLSKPSDFDYISNDGPSRRMAVAALDKALAENANKNQNVCFIMNSIGKSNNDEPDIAPVLMQFPVIVPYTFETQEDIRLANYLQRLKKLSQKTKDWEQIVFKGITALPERKRPSKLVNRQLYLFNRALRNPFDPTTTLKSGLSSNKLAFNVLQEQMSVNGHEFVKQRSNSLKKWVLHIKEDSLFTGAKIEREEVVDQGKFNDKIKLCENNGECCKFVSDAPFETKLSETDITTKDPSVVALYSAAEDPTDKKCISYIFSQLYERDDERASIVSVIANNLGKLDMGGDCPQCRTGGLLPKYLAKGAEAPRNNFEKFNSCDPSKSITIGYFRNKQRTMKEVAEQFEKVVQIIASESTPIKTTVKELGESDSFDILVDSEVYYTLKDIPTLFSYTIKDQKRGRLTNPISNDCDRCMAIKMDELLFGAAPPYAESSCCPSDDKKCINKYRNSWYPINDYLFKECRKSNGKKFDEFDDNDPINSPAAMLTEVEERFQKSNKPIFHLYYYVPWELTTDVDLQGRSCSDVGSQILTEASGSN